MVPEVHTKCSSIAVSPAPRALPSARSTAPEARREQSTQEGSAAPHCDLHQLISGHWWAAATSLAASMISTHASRTVARGPDRNLATLEAGDRRQ